jgi:citrate synthase
MLHKVLSEKIPIWQDEIRSVIQEKGNQKVGDVIVSQLYGGMRGIKGLTCETSAVSADKGLIIRDILY